MINNIYWLKSLSEYELKAFISWFNINGVNSPDEVLPFLESLTSGIDLKSFSMKDIITILKRGKEKGLKKIPEPLQYHITIAVSRLFEWCFEDDIQSQTIDMHEYKRQLTEMIEPLGLNSSFVFSLAFNTKESAIDETIRFHKNRWPFPPHKLDNFYSQLLSYQLIEPAGHFKDMFLIDNPQDEHRIIWKKNRTDLVYLGYRLYYKIYKDEFIEVISKIFCKIDKKGKFVTLQQLKKTNRNIRVQINDNELKGNWSRIDSIFKSIPLP